MNDLSLVMCKVEGDDKLLLTIQDVAIDITEFLRGSPRFDTVTNEWRVSLECVRL